MRRMTVCASKQCRAPQSAKHTFLCTQVTPCMAIERQHCPAHQLCPGSCCLQKIHSPHTPCCIMCRAACISAHASSNMKMKDACQPAAFSASMPLRNCASGGTHGSCAACSKQNPSLSNASLACDAACMAVGSCSCRQQMVITAAG